VDRLKTTRCGLWTTGPFRKISVDKRAAAASESGQAGLARVAAPADSELG
jgi:hypothetical protein